MGTTTNSTDEHSKVLANLLKEFKFEEAETYIKESVEERHLFLTFHLLADEETGLLNYTFVNYLLNKEETSFWHRLASSIAFESLNNILCGHNVGLYHILKAIELDPKNWELKEYALAFYKEGLLSQDETIPFAQEVLKHNPNNKLAMQVLEMPA